MASTAIITERRKEQERLAAFKSATLSLQGKTAQLWITSFSQDNVVIPALRLALDKPGHARAGIQYFQAILDPGLRRDDADTHVSALK